MLPLLFPRSLSLSLPSSTILLADDRGESDRIVSCFRIFCCQHYKWGRGFWSRSNSHRMFLCRALILVYVVSRVVSTADYIMCALSLCLPSADGRAENLVPNSQFLLFRKFGRLHEECSFLSKCVQNEIVHCNLREMNDVRLEYEKRLQKTIAFEWWWLQ